VDDFAVDFVVGLFEALWSRHMALAEAVGWSVRQAAKVPCQPRVRWSAGALLRSSPHAR
jgi:hypothetical protein